MSGRGYRRPLLRPHGVGQGHERRRGRSLEVVAGRLLKDRGGKRPERLPVLDPAVEDVLHLGTARVHHDAAVAERPRPPLHPPLEPADDLSAGDMARCLTAEDLLGQFPVALLERTDRVRQSVGRAARHERFQ